MSTSVLSDFFIVLDVNVLVIRVLSLREHICVKGACPNLLVEFRQLNYFVHSFLDAKEVAQLEHFPVECALKLTHCTFFKSIGKFERTHILLGRFKKWI